MIFSREEKETWSLFNKIGFRFLFIYFSFYCLTLISSSLFKPLVLWIGEHIFSIPYSFSSRGYGSGDTTYQYLLWFLTFSIALIGTFFWSIFDRRKSYNLLNYSLIILLRFVLIIFLFIYGFIKVFHLQMPPPDYYRLMEPLGEMSPMGLAWTFMGYSKTYSIFAGLSEVIAGLLLVSRRLQTIGAAMVIAVMGNVFIMNMAFDIPVKIFSLHLMLMGAFLFMSNSKRLVNAIIKGKAVKAEASYPVHNSSIKKPLRVIKIVLTALLFLIFLSFGYSRLKKFQEFANPPLHGVWEVKAFSKNNVELPSLTTDEYRWEYFIVSYKGRVSVKTMDHKTHPFFIEIDTLHNNIFISEDDVPKKDKLVYTLDGNLLNLSGVFENDSIQIQMKRKDDKDFILTSRDFRWINEAPNNQ